MQKKIIALAVAGLVSGAAFAQTNVTIWGVADIGFVSLWGDQDTATTDRHGRATGINSGISAGSRLGFKGEEKLGNGLDAFFHMEFGTLGNDNGTSGANGYRQSFIGLKGGFGTVAWGRIEAPGTGWHNKYDTHQAAGWGSQAQMRNSNGDTTLTTGTRLSGTVAYVSPVMSGFQATVAYSFDPANTQEQNEVVRTIADTGCTGAAGQCERRSGAFAARLEYDNGPFSVGATWHRLTDLSQSGLLGANSRQNDWGLGAKYNFGMAEVFGSYDHTSVDYVGPNRDYDSRRWQLGVAMPIGSAGRLAFSYTDHEGDDRAYAGGAALAPGLSNDASAWSLGYTHSLSKRTTIYTGYAHVKTDDGFVGLGNANASISAPGSTMQLSGNDKMHVLTVGMRHTF